MLSQVNKLMNIMLYFHNLQYERNLKSNVFTTIPTSINKYLNKQNSLSTENNCTQCNRGTETNYEGKTHISIYTKH